MLLAWCEAPHHYGVPSTNQPSTRAMQEDESHWPLTIRRGIEKQWDTFVQPLTYVYNPNVQRSTIKPRTALSKVHIRLDNTLTRQ